MLSPDDDKRLNDAIGKKVLSVFSVIELLRTVKAIYGTRPVIELKMIVADVTPD